MLFAESQPPLDAVHAFEISTLGALLGYIVLYRETRVAEFAQDPKGKWKTLVFDLVVYLLCGGLVTCFLVGPLRSKEAFEAGLAWQSIAGVSLLPRD